jgi:hypothetical protein
MSRPRNPIPKKTAAKKLPHEDLEDLEDNAVIDNEELEANSKPLVKPPPTAGSVQPTRSASPVVGQRISNQQNQGQPPQAHAGASNIQSARQTSSKEVAQEPIRITEDTGPDQRSIDPAARGSLQLLKNKVRGAGPNRRRSVGAEADQEMGLDSGSNDSGVGSNRRTDWTTGVPAEEPYQTRGANLSSTQYAVPQQPARNLPQTALPGLMGARSAKDSSRIGDVPPARVPLDFSSTGSNLRNTDTKRPVPTNPPNTAWQKALYEEEAGYDNNDDDDEGEDEDYNDEDEHDDGAANEYGAGVPDESGNIDPRDYVECNQCGRKMLPGPLQKHAKICAKVFLQKRKKFDSSKMRTKELEQELGAKKKSSKKASAAAAAPAGGGKPSWKDQSNAFREAMRAAREYTQKVADGEPLPPPIISAPDPSLIQCPHCARRFNARAAERHIPTCTSIKNKPTGLKRGSGVSSSSLNTSTRKSGYGKF